MRQSKSICSELRRSGKGRGPRARVRRSGGLKAERLFRPGRANPILLGSGSRALLLLQRIRDESHRFAIAFQRDLRSKLTVASILEELPGIGPVKRRALLRQTRLGSRNPGGIHGGAAQRPGYL